MVRLVLFIFALCSLLSREAAAQAFQIVPTQIEIVVAPGFNHVEQRVPITVADGVSVGGFTVSSDASWIVPTINATTKQVVLTFQTANLLNSSNTATITVTGGGTTDFFAVKTSLGPLNITKLVDDPLRSRTYGIQQNGVNAGALVALDPLTKAFVGCVTVGKKPCDLAISADASEALVINAADKSITAIDLATLQVKETIVLPTYINWGVADTTADVAYGAGSIIYYTDGSWAPVLYVFNRASGQILQQVTDNSNGFGDIVLSPNGSTLYGWTQYGWSAGYAGSGISKYSVGANGMLTFVERTTATYPNALMRDPLDTPVLIDAGATNVFAKQLAVNPAAVNDTKRTFPGPVYSITPGGEIAVTNSAIFQVSTALNLYTLPVATTVQAITSDYARLVYFNGTTRTIETVNLTSAIGSRVLNQNLNPADGAITLSPAKLQWSALPGVDTYRIYLGDAKAAVTAAASTGDATFLAEVNTPSVSVTKALTPGTKYYWRIDSVTSAGVSKGDVHEFTVATISSSLTSIETATVQGHTSHQVPVQLAAATSTAWQATADQPWVTFASTTGTTPSTLTVRLDASQLPAGVNTANVTVSLAGGTAAFTLPVTLEVDPLALTVMETDRTSGYVYALSEQTTTSGGTSRAYLLELDTAAKNIRRAVRVGSSATDLAVHNGDNRIYVANWRLGSLLAIDETSFQQVRSYAFIPYPTPSYRGDVYRVAAGAAGRVLVEAEDQWVNISIFDTAAGTVLKDLSSVREGGGEYAPGGRFYYHGDNNSSGAELHKYDLIGDVFTEVAHKRVETGSYYGSRTVVMAESGERIFWAGTMFDKDLSPLWAIGDEVFSTSPDGKYAFSATKIYDSLTHQAVLSMPVETRVSAYNSTTGRLVLQVGTKVRFYDVGTDAALPAPVLAPATAITTTGLTLNWTQDSLQSSFTLQKRLQGTTDWTDITPAPVANSLTYAVTGLGAGGTYEFRLKADSAAFSSPWSNTIVATTLTALQPQAITVAATNIQPTSATLNSQVNVRGSGSVTFDYGTTDAYGLKGGYPTATLFGTTLMPVGFTVNALQPNTLYHYRVVVTTGTATVRGEDLTFQTSLGAPTITLVGPVSSPNSLELRGTVNPNGLATTYRIDYGTTSALGQSTTTASVGSGSVAQSVSQAVTGLTLQTVYYYQLVATNSTGTSKSQLSTAQTTVIATAPVAILGQTTPSSRSLLLHGTVNPGATETNYYFAYGTTPSLGSTTPTLSAGSSVYPLDVTQAIGSLLPDTTYYFKLVATNSAGGASSVTASAHTLVDNVPPTPSAPKAIDDLAFTSQGEPVVIPVLANDQPTGGALSVVSVSPPAAGQVVRNGDGTLTYIPGSTFGGFDFFTYTLSDALDRTSTATVTIKDTFENVAGNYHALVGTHESVYEEAGSIGLTVSRLGGLTGKLQFAGLTYSLQTKLRPDGSAVINITSKGKLVLLVKLQIDPAAHRLTGLVADATGVATFTTSRVPFTTNEPWTKAARYTLVLPADIVAGETHGTGFATMTVSSLGAVKITGRTGLGTAFATTGFIDAQRQIALYAPAKKAAPASLQGMLQLKEDTMAASYLEGLLGWSQIGTGEYSQVQVAGAPYLVPAKGTLALPTTAGRGNVTLSAGHGSDSPLGNPVPLNLTASALASSNKAVSQVQLNLQTGLFSGTVLLQGKPVLFYGALYQKMSMGMGVVMSKGGAGWVRLEVSTPVATSTGSSSGVISIGAGTLNLNPANYFPGGFTGGVLNVGNVSVLQSTPTVTVLDPSTLTWSGATMVSGSTQVTSGSVLTLGHTVAPSAPPVVTEPATP